MEAQVRLSSDERQRYPRLPCRVMEVQRRLSLEERQHRARMPACVSFGLHHPFGCSFVFFGHQLLSE